MKSHRRVLNSQFPGLGVLLVFTLCTLSLPIFAETSSITEVLGEACMGRDMSRNQTEQAALKAAQGMAASFASTHIESTTLVENFEIKKDIIEAYSNADVKVVEILEQAWAACPSDCYTMRIRAEVVPRLDKLNEGEWMANPSLPLKVNLWVSSTDNQFTAGEKMKVFLQGNKPFYARLLYKMADGSQVQLLPNQHRSENYFQGATIFEVPTQADQFDLTVGAPFGAEKLVLFASTFPLGNVAAEPAGEDLYQIVGDADSISRGMRGISITSTNSGEERTADVAEFAEAAVEINTVPE